MIKEVFPKTETLKQQVLKRFHQDYDAYQEENVSTIRAVSGIHKSNLVLTLGEEEKTGRIYEDAERLRGSSNKRKTRSSSKRTFQSNPAS